MFRGSPEVAATDWPRLVVVTRGPQYGWRMWVTGDGQFHTVALPDVTTAMSERFIASLNALSGEDFGQLIEALSDHQDAFLEDFDASGVAVPNASTTPEQDALPDDYLDAEFDTPDALMTYLDGIDPSWRLDAYVAVEDYVWHYEDQPAGLLARLRRLFLRRV
jgi:hypothetical protein